MASAKVQPSAPFQSRELNGEVLLEELAELRAAQLAPKHLADLVVSLRSVQGAHVAEAQAHLKALATGRFSGQPALSSLLVRWAQKLKTEMDVPLLASHFERLALTSVLLMAVRRGVERLPKGGRG